MKLAVTSPSFSKHSVLQKEVDKYFPGARLNTSGERLSGDSLVKFVGDADALIVGLEIVDASFLDQCKNLKMVSKYGVGLDNIAVRECEARGIKVGWRGGVNKLSVAEMALGFMLMLGRNLFVTANQIKNGVWNKTGGFQLSGKTVGIIGFGHIGKEVARLLAPFNCELLVNDIIDVKEACISLNCIECTKEEIFIRADFVTIHAPLTDLTRNLIDIETLGKMKNSSFVINTARGGIVNQNDLKKALKDGLIAGAALDVFDNEPEDDTELFTFPNLIGTPHIGGNAREAVEAMGLSAIEHLRKFFKL